MIKYVSLHNHSTFSILDGLSSPLALMEKAKEMGQDAIAITDHGSLAGAWDSLQASKKTGVKLIIGSEMYFKDDVKDEQDTRLRHIVLLAKNHQGYKNLLALQKEGFEHQVIFAKKSIPRIDWDMLSKYKDGLICLTACGQGILSQLIMYNKMDEAKKAAIRLKEIFGDDLALELQPHNLTRKENMYSSAVDQRRVNLGLKQIGHDLDIRCVVATDSHYIEKEHHDAMEVLLSIGSGQPFESGQRLNYNVSEFHVKSAIEIAHHFFRHRPMWVKDDERFIEKLFENTIYLADKCEQPNWIDPFVATGKKNQLPKFKCNEEPDYQEFLNWCQEKTSKLYKENLGETALFYRFRTEKGLTKKIEQKLIKESDFDRCYEQIFEEFDVLEYKHYNDYMLIVAEFVNWCKENGILTGVGRGSGGGSLTAYLNGIHKTNTVKYDLLFARFLNKYKDAFPDFDIDVAPSGRDALQNHLREKYGMDNVAAISNVNTITPKVYARDLARVFQFGGDRKQSVKIGNDIADSIPDSCNTVKRALEEAPLFAEYAKKYTELEKFAETVGGKARAWSTHAAGLVICTDPVHEVFPVRIDTHGNVCTQNVYERVETQGGIKIDLLGLDSLDIVSDACRLIENNGKEAPSILEFDYDQYDEKSYDLIGRGDTFGVFQLAGVATNVCKLVKPKCIEDIAMITSLIRPASKEIIPDLLKVRSGEKPLELLHPALDRALTPTYGFGLYEECLMVVAADVAGWDLHKADNLRKMTKQKGKYPAKIKKLKAEFIQSAYDNKGIDNEAAESIWTNVVEVFTGYGFNKSLYFSENVDTYSSEGQYLDTKPIKDIKAGEYVCSRDENTGDNIYIEVLANHDHGELEVVEVELETGEKVKCTMNHKFRTVETGEMLPLHDIINKKLSIMVK